MFKKRFTMAWLAFGIAMSPATQVAAGNNGLLPGLIIGGIIGSEIQRNSKRPRKVYRGVPSAVRQERREIQTSLNYFGFPAGVADGVLGRRSRAAISDYQTFMGYPTTGHLSDYGKGFLLTSYRRAIAGGGATMQLISTLPGGPRGLLLRYRDEAAGTNTTTANIAPLVAAPAPGAGDVLPNFVADNGGQSLASHCNKVSLLTNTNGGFTTAASMTDASFALSEQFCLARTYAIATGEELVSKVQGFTPDQIATQCEAFGPALKDYVAALSLKPREDVLRDVGGFVLNSGMTPVQLSGTAKICLSVGYRTDNMDVAIGSALLLTALGEQAYGELLGHHLSQGFGANKRADLSLAWYQAGIDAIQGGAPAVFAPGQPERNDLIHKAAFKLTSSDQANGNTKIKALPVFSVDN